MVRWLNVARFRRLILYSHRRCFLLMVTAVLLMLLLYMWNPTSVDRRYWQRDSFAAFTFSSADQGVLRNYSASVPWGDLDFAIQPTCGVCRVLQRGVRDYVTQPGMLGRWEELLEARPDGEEPKPPPPIETTGVIFVLAETADAAQRRLIRRTWGSGAWRNDTRARVIFVCEHVGSDDTLMRESMIYGDILQVSSTKRHALSESGKTAAALKWISRTCAGVLPDFVVKTSATAFVNINGVLAWISSLPEGGIHGHFTDLSRSFSGNHFAQAGSDVKAALSKQKRVLDAAFYLINGYQTLEQLLIIMPQIKSSPFSDEVFVQLAAGNAAVAVHETVHYQSSWRGASGCWLIHQTVYVGLGRSDFEELWRTMADISKFTCTSGDGCCEDSFWGIFSLMLVWALFLLLQLSIIHSYFWSSLAFFCNDLCNTVDSGAEDNDDSPEGSTMAYDSDNEWTEPLYDFNRPFSSTVHQERF